MGIEYFKGLASLVAACSDPDKCEPPPSFETPPEPDDEGSAVYEESIQPNYHRVPVDRRMPND